MLLFVIYGTGETRVIGQDLPPTLNQILEKLESNLRSYRSAVPSYSCEEHLVSKVHQYSYEGSAPRNLDTDSKSVFRIKRVTNADQTTTLTESRDVESINGHAPQGKQVDGPSILSGAFLGGLSFVSLSQQACMQYTLRPIKSGSAKDPYVVEFTSPYLPVYPPGCLLREAGSGLVYIDPATMQITRIKLVAPKHGALPRLPDGSYTSALLSVWDVSVVYAPVALDGQTYWLPSVISSTTKNGYVDWSFKATYRNYHKLEVTSRILNPEELPPRIR